MEINFETREPQPVKTKVLPVEVESVARYIIQE